MASNPPQLSASDPTLDAELQQAQSADVTALQQEAQGDSASLMARYGTRLAIAGGSSGTPSVSGSTSGNPFATFADAARGITGQMGRAVAPMAAVAQMYANR